MKTLYKNAKLVMPYRIIDGWLETENGIITALGVGTPAGKGDSEINLNGNYLAPGFIEMHTHGGAGYDFADGTEEAYLECAKHYAKAGVTTLYPTLTTTSPASFAEALATFKRAKKDNKTGSRMPGLHLEGPYFAYAMKGAQDPRFLRDPDPAEYLQILDSCSDIKRWSAAPELPGGIAFGRELRKRGIVAAMGHTDGLFEELMEAYENGYTHMTHFYSAMSTVRRINAFRHSGAVEIGYMLDDVTIEIIADGIHIPPELLRQIFKFKSHDKISLIADAMRGAGLPEGTKTMLGSFKDGMEVIIEDGVAKLTDRTAFAGSVATAPRLLRTVTLEAGLELTDAVKMMTLNPAKVMGIDNECGSLAIGKRADFVAFDPDIHIKFTVIGGEEVLSVL
ncbi:MAG TPA: N-acetylglucosamine-6-phosphate deacetylase [Oscillospiraceae bacterium]|nr:N-acetylglucosamine-6-phosphate deacetylase [Oscillospiraceae bacterium]HPS34503.1 N-acetylglucosamine-6-phosphate deacetylase [Oscillospiraceae bacterium]